MSGRRLERTLADGAAIAAGASRARSVMAANGDQLHHRASATLGARSDSHELATQTLDRHGSWGPPRLMMARQEEWLAVPDPLDRQIAQMLLGTRAEHAWYQPPTGRRYAIAETSYDTTLRLMCETGRCRIRSQAGELEPPVATWDGGDPWELVLELISTQDGDGYLLVARLYRNETRMGERRNASPSRRARHRQRSHRSLRHFAHVDMILGSAHRGAVGRGLDCPDLLATLYCCRTFRECSSHRSSPSPRFVRRRGTARHRPRRRARVGPEPH